MRRLNGPAKVCLLVILMMLTVTGKAFAQSYTVQAVLSDGKTEEPVAFATVYVTLKGEKSPSKYALSDEKGAVKLTGVKKGVYILKAELIGYKTYEQEINIYDEAEYYGNNIKKIDRMRKMVGFYKRRVADLTTTPADLAYDAAQKLIKEMKIDKDSIDALIFVVQQPDVMNPATAYFIHQKLGLSDDCLAMDINQGCVGWVYGLYMAHLMIASGMHKKILLLNGDTPSVGVDLSNRNVAPIFGDGGTATLLEKTDEVVDAFFNIETQSYGYEAIIAPFSGTRFRTPLINDEDFELLAKLRKERITMPTGNDVSLFSGYIDGLAVFDFTVKFVPENIKKLLLSFRHYFGICMENLFDEFSGRSFRYPAIK